MTIQPDSNAMNPTENPYDPNHYAPSPAVKSSWSLGKIAIFTGLGAFGAIGLCIVVCCGGSFALFGYGMELAKGAVQEELQYNTGFRRQLGDVQSVELNLEKTGECEDELIAFDVVGSKGKGVVYAEFDDRGENLQIKRAYLEVESGGRVQIIPDSDGTVTAN